MASENNSCVKGAKSLFGRGLELPVFCSLEMFGWFSITGPGHSRPIVKCSLKGSHCWSEMLAMLRPPWRESPCRFPYLQVKILAHISPHTRGNDRAIRSLPLTTATSQNDSDFVNRFCYKHFMSFISLNPPNSPKMGISYHFHFTDEGTKAEQRG